MKMVLGEFFFGIAVINIDVPCTNLDDIKVILTFINESIVVVNDANNSQYFYAGRSILFRSSAENLCENLKNFPLSIQVQNKNETIAVGCMFWPRRLFQQLQNSTLMFVYSKECDLVNNDVKIGCIELIMRLETKTDLTDNLMMENASCRQDPGFLYIQNDPEATTSMNRNVGGYSPSCNSAEKPLKQNANATDDILILTDQALENQTVEGSEGNECNDGNVCNEISSENNNSEDPNEINILIDNSNDDNDVSFAIPPVEVTFPNVGSAFPDNSTYCGTYSNTSSEIDISTNRNKAFYDSCYCNEQMCIPCRIRRLSNRFYTTFNKYRTQGGAVSGSFDVENKTTQTEYRHSQKTDNNVEADQAIVDEIVEEFTSEADAQPERPCLNKSNEMCSMCNQSSHTICIVRGEQPSRLFLSAKTCPCSSRIQPTCSTSAVKGMVNKKRKIKKKPLYSYSLVRPHGYTYFPKSKLNYAHCTKPVPPQMGWLWNTPENDTNCGWRPGAIPKNIKNMMRHFLINFPKDRLFDTANERACKACFTKCAKIKPMPKLQVCKRGRDYYVTMKSPKNPNCIEAGYNIIQYKVSENPVKAKIRRLKEYLRCQGFKKCVCHKPIACCTCRSNAERIYLVQNLNQKAMRCRLPCDGYSLVLSDSSDCEDDYDFHIKDDTVKPLLFDEGTQYTPVDYGGAPLPFIQLGAGCKTSKPTKKKGKKKDGAKQKK